MFEDKKIAVLLPCYNEEQSIEKVVTDFRHVLPSADIYVYDNNSTDSSASLAEKAGAIVITEPAQGKGNVIRSMFSDINADIYIMSDADDTYNADDAPRLIQAIIEGYDIAIGDRLSTNYYEENKRPMHNAGNNFMRCFINRLFQGRINDILTGYRAFSKRFVKNFPVLSSGFEVETEMSIFTLNNRIKYKNVPILYKDRASDSPSKLRTIPDGIKCIKKMLNMVRIYRPLMFYGIIAVILCILATAFFIPVLKTYYIYHIVKKFPTLIVCCFTYLTAIQLFVLGLLLNAINYLQKQMFENSFKR